MSPDSIGDEIRRFEEQYRRNPHGLVFARLADAHRKSGDPESALSILEEGIARHPDYPSGHLVRARALTDLNRPAAAEDSLRRVLELDPRNLVALRGLATLAEKRGDAAEAVRLLEQATIYEPSDADLEADLARLRGMLPEPTETVVAAERAPLPAPDEEWWSSPPEAAAQPGGDAPQSAPREELEPREDRVPAEEVETALQAYGAVLGEPAPGSETAEPREDVVPPALEPTADVDAAEEHAAAEERGEAHGAVEQPGEARENSAVEATSSPPSKASQNDWWFEDPDEEEAPEDGDLLTRTMAELYVKQGLLAEAAAIYRELASDRPDDEGLRAALAELEARIGSDATDTEAASTGADEVPAAVHDDAVHDDAVDAEPAAEVEEAVTGVAVEADQAAPEHEAPDHEANKAHEAHEAEEPEDEGPAPDPYASHPVPRRSGASDVYRDWIRRLSG